MVFSSSAAVYGAHSPMPVQERTRLQPESVYGFTKVQGEQMLDWMARQRGWSVISLRYFNPVGAHPSGRIGQPVEAAGSLMARALLALSRGHAAPLTVFGTDYETPDGTCLRDYIHIRDLSRAHLVALTGLQEPGHHIYNVGSGRAHSVRQVLATCSRVTGRPIAHEDGPRRPGDMPIAVADPTAFADDLGFRTELGLDEMVASAWRWWTLNPEGYP